MTSALDQKGLDACPFCGGHAVLDPFNEPDGEYFVYCSGHETGCRCDLGRFDSKDEAIAAWNRRAYLTAVIPADIAGVVEKLRSRARDLPSKSPAALNYREAATLIERLAAKDAELSEAQQRYVDANEARIAALEAQLAERAGGVNEDALRALAQAYDREDAAQRGEPDPWNLDDPGDIGDSDTWVSERIACARAAAEAFLSALTTEPAAPEGRQDDDDAIRALTSGESR